MGAVPVHRPAAEDYWTQPPSQGSVPLAGSNMPKAVWNGQVLAESDKTIDVHGTPYFPPDSIRQECFAPNSRTTVCGWKGTANYYDVTHKETGETIQALAWQYNETKEAANHFKSYIAFYPPVRVVSE